MTGLKCRIRRFPRRGEANHSDVPRETRPPLAPLRLVLDSSSVSGSEARSGVSRWMTSSRCRFSVDLALGP